jgi:GTP cyclohydrolase I
MSMQQSYANILTAVGEDLNRPGLKDTPIRAAKAFSFLTSGYGKTLEEVTNSAVFPSDNHEMVLVKILNFILYANIIFCHFTDVCISPTYLRVKS